MVKINRNPLGFITSSDNMGLIKSESNMGTDAEFLEKINGYLDKHNIKIDDKIDLTLDIDELKHENIKSYVKMLQLECLKQKLK